MLKNNECDTIIVARYLSLCYTVIINVVIQENLSLIMHV